MEIRPINKSDDRFAISRIYEESWKYAYNSIIPGSYLNSIPKGHWADCIDSPDMNSLIISADNQMIGTSSFCKSRFSDMKGYGEIVSIYLLPQYIGKGYGKHLLAASVSSLIQLGFDGIFLWVLNDNVNARRFYEKNDFQPNGHFMFDNIGGKELKVLQYVLQRG